jgi:hypothetical protein
MEYVLGLCIAAKYFPGFPRFPWGIPREREYPVLYTVVFFPSLPWLSYSQGMREDCIKLRDAFVRCSIET